MNKKELLALLVFPCALAACGAPRIAGVPVNNPAIVVPYPASFRAQHRVTLSLFGKQFDFTGYLLVRRPGAWRASAFGEFGGVLFDIASFPGKGPRVISSVGGIRKRWLTGPAADIIEILYLSPEGNPDSPMASATRNGKVYDIAYSDYAEFPGVERKIPRHIVVENKKRQLRLEVDLIKLEPMEIPENLVNIQ